MSEIARKTTMVSDELDIYCYFIKVLCVLENIGLSVAEINLLSYYIKWGISSKTEKDFMKDFKCGRQRVSNLKHHLSKKGFVAKDEDLNIWKILPAFLAEKRERSLSILLEFNVAK